jgi:hypothetical protein
VPDTPVVVRDKTHFKGQNKTQKDCESFNQLFGPPTARLRSPPKLESRTHVPAGAVPGEMGMASCVKRLLQDDVIATL